MISQTSYLCGIHLHADPREWARNRTQGFSGLHLHTASASTAVMATTLVLLVGYIHDMVNAILNAYHAYWPCECDKDDALASGNIDVLSGHRKSLYSMHFYKPTPLAAVCFFSVSILLDLFTAHCICSPK
jgi:hypothetical protein